MADYGGYTGEPFWTHLCVFPVRRIANGFVFDSSKQKSGTDSIKMQSGERKEIWFGIDAGARSASVWTWPPVGGKTLLIVAHPDTHDAIGMAINAGTEAWEQLSVNFVAEKGVYKVILINGTSELMNGAVMPRPAWFDDILVE